MTCPVPRPALALAAAAGLAACIVPVPMAGPTAGGSADEIRAAAVAVNRHRGDCPPLAWNEAAARAAQLHSIDMARRRTLSHRGSDGSTTASRLTAQGVAFNAVAENVASGYAHGEDVVRGWMRSPAHRENIQWCAVTRVGVGAANGYWTMVLYGLRGRGG